MHDLRNKYTEYDTMTFRAHGSVCVCVSVQSSVRECERAKFIVHRVFIRVLGCFFFHECELISMHVGSLYRSHCLRSWRKRLLCVCALRHLDPRNISLTALKYISLSRFFSHLQIFAT